MTDTKEYKVVIAVEGVDDVMIEASPSITMGDFILMVHEKVSFPDSTDDFILLGVVDGSWCLKWKQGISLSDYLVKCEVEDSVFHFLLLRQEAYETNKMEANVRDTSDEDETDGSEKQDDDDNGGDDPDQGYSTATADVPQPKTKTKRMPLKYSDYPITQQFKTEVDGKNLETLVEMLHEMDLREAEAHNSATYIFKVIQKKEREEEKRQTTATPKPAAVPKEEKNITLSFRFNARTSSLTFNYGTTVGDVRTKVAETFGVKKGKKNSLSLWFGTFELTSRNRCEIRGETFTKELNITLNDGDEIEVRQA